MRALHVLAPGEFGGLETVVAGLAAAQRRVGLDPHVALVVSPRASITTLEQRLLAVGVPVHNVITTTHGYVREFRMIRALCKQLAPAVVHTHGYRPDVVAAAAARAAGVAVVSTVHGFTGGGWRMRLYEHLQRRALRRCDAVIAVSVPLRNRLAEEGLPLQRLHVVPNAYEATPALPRGEARALLGLAETGFVAGWVGRLSHEKAADVFLDALAALSPRVVARAVFVGDGPLRSSLTTRAVKLGLGNRVCWCGSVPEAHRILTAFDALVLSSRTEGTPMVLLEAMAAGVPIVATRVGGVAAMLGDAEAWLVAPERPGELASALEAIVNAPSAARHRAKLAAIRLQREFGVAEWTREYAGIYDSVVARDVNRS